MRTLTNVLPSDVENMRALADSDLGALEACVRNVRRIARNDRRADEVIGYASQIVAGCYLRGVAMGAPDAHVAAEVAVTYARQAVADAWSGVDSLEEWAGIVGDAVERYTDSGDSASMPRPWTSTPDACARTTDADAVAAVLADAPPVLVDSARAYARHTCGRVLPVLRGAGKDGADVPAEVMPGTCEHCDHTTRGARPTLAGILNHTRRLTREDSDFHVNRRAVLRALADLPTAEVARDLWDTRPAPRAVWSDETRALADSMRTRPAPRPDTRALPDTDAVLIRRPDGTTARDSHARIVKGAPDVDETTARENARAESLAAAPPLGKPADPSRRPSRTGAYSAQVDRRAWRTLGMTS